MSRDSAIEIRSRVVEAAGFKFWVNETGDSKAPPLLLLHGSGPGATALSNWEGVMAELGRDFHCVAPDIVGFGDSTHPEDPPVGTGPFAQLRAETLLGLIQALGLSEITVVGNSMGGTITLRMLATDPTPFEKVVLMASGGAPTSSPPPALGRLAFFYNEPTEQKMAELMSEFVSDPAVFGDRLQAIAASRMPIAERPDVRRSHIATFTFVDSPMVDLDAVGRITQPVLVIHGREDRLIPVSSASWFAETISDSQVHILSHCGHWVQIEQRDRFVFLVRAFARGDI